MQPSVTIRWLESFRAVAYGAVMTVLVLLLTSCSASSILTDSSGSAGRAEPKGKTVPPVAVQQITGIPPGKLAELRSALSAAGGQHDIGFVEGDFQSGVFSLSGEFRASNASAGVSITYRWQFRDAEGVLIATIDGEDNAGVHAGSDPWAGVSGAVLDRIARRTAEEMANKLAAMGYAARLAGLTAPPAEYFAAAARDAHREIDFETVNGPGLGGLGAAMLAGAGKIVKHEDIPPTVAAVEPIPGEALMARVAEPDGPSAAAPAPEENAEVSGEAPEAEVASAAAPGKTDREAKARPEAKPASAKPGQREIRAVAVVPVEGSPGAGDAELTAAMRKTLSAAGWPVVSKPGPDALTIVGRVKVAAKGESNEAVSVRWEVRSPDGRTLGDVKQANEVPKGALDAGWGPAALAVAEAAAGGIFDIVKRFQ
ncbi:hypothetical protein [Aestuariivirga sp.]|uniref:hypothetical protein n=1 Tax=Aestuariivirga sp. TaxID=2650926 RepID=UPI0039187281